MFSVACSAGFASCKTFGKQPKPPCFGRSPNAGHQSLVSLHLCIDSHLCRCIVQRLCVADCKRPCLVRAAAPHSARHGCRACMPKGSMQGRIQVVEQSRCRTHRQQTTTIAETQSPQSVLVGIEKFHYSLKNNLFLQTEIPRQKSGD